jgi:phosphoribosylformylglycinamidine synthase
LRQFSFTIIKQSLKQQESEGMSQKYQSRIYVTLRPSVLDPAGTAVESGLKQLGYESVAGVRIGKYIELTIDAENSQVAKENLEVMCDRLLANPVIENYRIELEEV